VAQLHVIQLGFLVPERERNIQTGLLLPDAATVLVVPAVATSIVGEWRMSFSCISLSFVPCFLIVARGSVMVVACQTRFGQADSTARVARHVLALALRCRGCIGTYTLHPCCVVHICCTLFATVAGDGMVAGLSAALSIRPASHRRHLQHSRLLLLGHTQP
jgi:hypothetical protein